MSIRYRIDDQDDVDISFDGLEIEVRYNSDDTGNYYVDIPIKFIKRVLALGKDCGGTE